MVSRRRSPLSAERSPITPPQRLSRKKLAELVEEAIIDCYGEAEQATGLFTMIDEHLSTPFRATVLGVDVTVEKIDITDRDEVVVWCRRGVDRQWLRILDVRPSHPAPAGWEWVEAYRQWARGGR